ncbi:MAG: HD domain-containing protein [Silvanigrellales bacterium]|nr:HD domain-containing protein [Silvanigrellales bacterium]
MSISSSTFHGLSLASEPSSGLKFVGKIRDPLHDTIPFTAAEKAIINSPEFQRLRRIQQTAFIKYVFPGATHTRFEHSLGVMHMSGVMLSRLIANQTRLLESLASAVEAQPPLVQSSFSLTEQMHGSLRETHRALPYLGSPEIAQALRFSALLHDVGHAPYSHSMERFLPTWAEVRAALPTLGLPDYLRTALEAKITKLTTREPGRLRQRVRHELYTLLIVARLFTRDAPFLGAEMGQDVCSLIDCDVPPSPGGALERSGLQALLHEMVSGELDVDRMDYLMRDSRQCGVVYGFFDAGRILDSAGFYFDSMTGRFHLALRRSGVAAFEDFLRARWSMYQQVYFHKTATACEAMLEALRKFCPALTLPLDTEAYLKLDDASFPEWARARIPEGQEEAGRLIDDLFFNRYLWKRVYEESAPKSALSTQPSLCPAILHYLQRLSLPAELAESGTSLTRFAPRSARSSHSENSLRVIVKDVHSLRFLEPIENHSALIGRNDEETIVRRIFVGRRGADGKPIDTDAVQRLVSSTVVTPKLD